jgi:predicted Rossmann fold flavoprotein
MSNSFDVIILGAGAAGLMCALTAGQRGRRVLVLDHADKAGAKILISGGGRCNFTNRVCTPENFLSENPHFCRSALDRYPSADFIALVEKHGIAFHEKTLGQLFCDGSARAIVAMLLAECEAGGVAVRLSHRITDVARTDGFRITTDHAVFTAPALVLATGGPAIPKMGATGFAYDVARQFGMKVVPPRPALVPLRLTPAAMGLPHIPSLAEALAGVALEAIAAAEGPPLPAPRFREAVLVTHRGLSGPAILQASSYWRPGGTISLNLLPAEPADALLLARKRQRPNAELRTVLAEFLPARLAHAVAAGEPVGQIAGIPDKTLIALGQRLANWRVRAAESEGYAKAEVTAGGIDTAGLSSKTMAAKTVPGLYCIGEAVDVTGWLGGFNFQWAWASGHCAGVALAA